MAKAEYPLKLLILRKLMSVSLVPLLTIEVVLLALYFGINWYIARENKATLLEEVRNVAVPVIRGESQSIHNQLRMISQATGLVQFETERYFGAPSQFPQPKVAPQFARAANGSFYKTSPGGCSLFYANNTQLGPAEMRKAAGTEALDPIYEKVQKSTPSVVAVYLNTHDNMNRLYPYIPEVYKQYPPDLRMTDYNFYYLADAAHNPSRKTAWTGAYLDPAGNGWMVSCVAPVYRGDFLEGVIGLDMTIENMTKGILKLDLPWGASAFLADAQGTILAMPEAVESVLSLKELKRHTYSKAIKTEMLKPEEFNLFRNPDKDLASTFRDIVSRQTRLTDIRVRGRDYVLVQEVEPETGWRLMMIIDRSMIYAPILRLEGLSNALGLAAVVLMALFYVAFFTVLFFRAKALSQKISEPVEKLAEATAEIGCGKSTLGLQHVGIAELDHLSENFERMQNELDLRTRALVEERIAGELKEKEAQFAYQAGLFESASAYLHNIGNALAGVDGYLKGLKQVTEAAERYPEAIRSIRGAHERSLSGGGADETPALLDRLEKVLVEGAVPRIRENVARIQDAHKGMVTAIRHQQDMFSESRDSDPHKYVRPVDLDELARDVMSDFKETFSQKGILAEFDSPGRVLVQSQKFQIQNGLVNLVRNAVEAVEAAGRGGGKIRVALSPPREEGGGAVFRVSDDGVGMSQDVVERLFTAGFTTKDTGHGLGLHSFAMFLNAHCGTISASSPGHGRGAEFVVEIANEPDHIHRG